MRIFLYPGSFDPVTLGHMDIIDRASKLCDKLIVAVLTNAVKSTVFTMEERVNLLKTSLKGRDNIEVDHFTGLLADYAKKKNISTIVKGLRAVSDFEYELQMAILNKKLNLETLLLITNLDYLYLSSSMVRDLARNNADISAYVPAEIIDVVKAKYKL